jgi:hypothetical protein
MKTTVMTKQVIEPTTDNTQAVQQWFAGLPPEQQFPKFSEPILFHGIDFERCGDAIRQSLGFAKPSAAPYVSAGLREIWDTRWYGSCVSEPGRM